MDIHLQSMMYFSTFLVTLSFFNFYSSHAGPITEKLKLYQTLATETNARPPGILTFSNGKREEMGRASFDGPVHSLKQSEASHSCLSGMWTCSTGKRSELTKEAPVAAKALHNKKEPDSESLKNCSQGIRICRKIRMFKRMLRKEKSKLKLYKASKDGCPLGVWTCSTERG